MANNIASVAKELVIPMFDEDGSIFNLTVKKDFILGLRFELSRPRDFFFLTPSLLRQILKEFEGK